MRRDERYDYVNYLYQRGEIKSFYDLFKNLPKSVLAKDMGIGMKRFRELVDCPQKLTYKDVLIISFFFKINSSEMLQLILRQYLLNAKSKSKVGR